MAHLQIAFGFRAPDYMIYRRYGQLVRHSFAVAAASLVISLAPTVTSADSFVGIVVSVVDGDDLIVRRLDGRQLDVRLCGIDAPESHRAGGREATQALATLAIGKSIRCVPVGSGTPCDGRSNPTNRGRLIAQCFIGSEDVADRAVCSGHARDWPRYSGGHYGSFARCG